MFEGFPRAGLELLRGLSANNNKAWFEEHRGQYEDGLLEPAKDLVVDLGKKLQDQISPDIQADPRFNGSIMRISRDIRFSKDKSPYKNWLGLWFWEGGPRRSMESPGFYFSLHPDQLVLGAGKHAFDKPMLDKYRSAAVDPKTGPGLLKVVEQARAAGYDVGGKSYKQAPRGYEPKEPETAEMLLYGALHAGSTMPVPPEAHSPAFVDFCVITGSQDNAHQRSLALQEHIAGCELITMEGAGHACNMERPWEWDALCLRFLSQHGLLPVTP